MGSVLCRHRAGEGAGAAAHGAAAQISAGAARLEVPGGAGKGRAGKEGAWRMETCRKRLSAASCPRGCGGAARSCAAAGVRGRGRAGRLVLHPAGTGLSRGTSQRVPGRFPALGVRANPQQHPRLGGREELQLRAGTAPGSPSPSRSRPAPSQLFASPSPASGCRDPNIPWAEAGGSPCAPTVDGGGCPHPEGGGAGGCLPPNLHVSLMNCSCQSCVSRQNSS